MCRGRMCRIALKKNVSLRAPSVALECVVHCVAKYDTCDTFFFSVHSRVLCRTDLQSKSLSDLILSLQTFVAIEKIQLAVKWIELRMIDFNILFQRLTIDSLKDSKTDLESELDK